MATATAHVEPQRVVLAEDVTLVAATPVAAHRPVVVTVAIQPSNAL